MHVFKHDITDKLTVLLGNLLHEDGPQRHSKSMIRLFSFIIEKSDIQQTLELVKSFKSHKHTPPKHKKQRNKQRNKKINAC